MPKYILFGDIHGCIDEFKYLVSHLKSSSFLHPDVEIVYCGDLIHKGPDSEGVLDFAIHLSELYKTTLVLGNHEEKHLRWLKNLEKGKANKMKHVEDYPNIRLTSKHLDFLTSSVLFYKLDTIVPKIVVHGGIPPIIRTLPENNKISYFESIDSRDKKFYYQILRTRYVDPRGHMVSLGQETSSDVFWAEYYDGRFGHAYFGHQPFLDTPKPVFPNATALDYGCVYGHALRTIYIDSSDSEDKYIQLSSFKKYANTLNYRE